MDESSASNREADNHNASLSSVVSTHLAAGAASAGVVWEQGKDLYKQRVAVKVAVWTVVLAAFIAFMRNPIANLVEIISGLISLTIYSAVALALLAAAAHQVHRSEHATAVQQLSTSSPATLAMPVPQKLSNEQSMPPAEIFTQRWKLPRPVVAKLGTTAQRLDLTQFPRTAECCLQLRWLSLLVETSLMHGSKKVSVIQPGLITLGTFFFSVISSDQDFGRYCRYTVTNAVGRLSNAVSVLGQTNDGAPVRPTMLLLQDVAAALEYHLHWYTVMRKRAEVRTPELWQGDSPSCSAMYAASGHELGREDTDEYPSPSHSSGSRPWQSARTLAVQYEVGAAELDVATGGDGQRVSILHPACYTHDISCLGSTLHTHQQQQRGMADGDTPTALLPCVVPPATATGNSTQEHQMRYLRTISAQLVPRLLAREDIASPALRLIMRELLAGSVLLPLMQALADPHTLNGVLRDALAADDTAAEDVLEGMADVATGGVASAAEEGGILPSAEFSDGSSDDSDGVVQSPSSRSRGNTGGSGVSHSSASVRAAEQDTPHALARDDSGRSVQEAGAVFGHVAASGDTGNADTPDAASGSMPSQQTPRRGSGGGGAGRSKQPASARYVIGRTPLPVDTDFDRADGASEDAGWLFFGGEQTASRATSLLRGAPPCSFTLRSPPKAPPKEGADGISSRQREQAADQYEQADVIATALDGVVVTYVSLEGQLVHVPVGVHTPSTTKQASLYGKFFIAQVVEGEQNKFLQSIKGAFKSGSPSGAQSGGTLLPSAHSIAAASRQEGGGSPPLAEAGSVVVIQDGRVQCNRSSWKKLTSSSGRRDLPSGGLGGRPLKVAPVGGAYGSMAALLRGWLLHVARYGLLWSAADSSGMPPLVCLYAEDAEGWRSGEGVHSTGAGMGEAGGATHDGSEGNGEATPHGVAVTAVDTAAVHTGAHDGEPDSDDSDGWSVVGPQLTPLTGGVSATARLRSDTAAAVCDPSDFHSAGAHRKASSVAAGSVSSAAHTDGRSHFHSHLTGGSGRIANKVGGGITDPPSPTKQVHRSTALRYGGLQRDTKGGGAALPEGTAPPAVHPGQAADRPLSEALQSARAKLPSPEFPTSMLTSMLGSFGGASASVVASDELSRAIVLSNSLAVRPEVSRDALHQLVQEGFSAQREHDRLARRFKKAWILKVGDSLVPRLFLRRAPADLLMEEVLRAPLPPLSGSVTTATRSDIKGSGLPGSTKVVIRYELALQFAMLPTQAQIPCGGYTSWAAAQFAAALMQYMPADCKQWSIRLRYSELLALHEQLQRVAPWWRPTAPFPGKRPNLFGSNLDKGFIMARATGLRKWLQGVLSTPGLSTCAEVRSALVPNAVEQAATKAAQWVDPLLAGILGEPRGSPVGSGADSEEDISPRAAAVDSLPLGRRRSDGGPTKRRRDSRVRFLSSPSLMDSELPAQDSLGSGSSADSDHGADLQGTMPSPLRLAETAQQGTAEHATRGAAAAAVHAGSASADFVMVPGAPDHPSTPAVRPSPLQAARKRATRRRRNTMSPLELHALELHVFGVIGALFDLQSQSWLRRNFVTVTRSVGKLLFHGTAASAIKAWYLRSTAEDSIADWLGVLSVKLWPQSTWFSELPGYAEQARAEWCAHKQWTDREQLLLVLRDTMCGSKLPSLLGSQPVSQGAERLHELLNCPLLLRSLAYTVLDALLARMFPGLATHGLRQKEAVDAAWGRVGGSGSSTGRAVMAGLAAAANAQHGPRRAPGSVLLGGLGSNLQQWFSMKQ